MYQSDDFKIKFSEVVLKYSTSENLIGYPLIFTRIVPDYLDQIKKMLRENKVNLAKKKIYYIV